GTSGAIFKSSHDGRFYGLTVAHLLDEQLGSAVGQRIFQPAFEDFVAEINNAKSEEKNAYFILQKMENKEHYEYAYQRAKRIASHLSAIENDHLINAQSPLILGTVRQSRHINTRYKGRTCLLDYALYEIETRFPYRDHFSRPNPNDGILSKEDWSNSRIKSIQDLSSGEMVWKRGRTTGTTFGFLSQVPCVVSTQGELREEFCVFSDGRSKSSFAEKGDSGAIVVTSNGDAIGIVTLEYMFFGQEQIILSQSAKALFRRHPDIIAAGCDDDRVASMVALAGCRSRYLVQSLKMVVEDLDRPDLELY